MPTSHGPRRTRRNSSSEITVFVNVPPSLHDPLGFAMPVSLQACLSDQVRRGSVIDHVLSSLWRNASQTIWLNSQQTVKPKPGLQKRGPKSPGVSIPTLPPAVTLPPPHEPGTPTADLPDTDLSTQVSEAPIALPTPTQEILQATAKIGRWTVKERFGQNYESCQGSRRSSKDPGWICNAKGHETEGNGQRGI